jgi:hypothetical protein
VRRGDAPLATAYRDLAELAHRRWISVLAVARTAPVGLEAQAPAAAADRVGRIEPSDDHGLCEAILLANRYGPRHTCRLRLDAGSGRLLADDAPGRGA